MRAIWERCLFIFCLIPPLLAVGTNYSILGRSFSSSGGSEPGATVSGATVFGATVSGAANRAFAATTVLAQAEKPKDIAGEWRGTVANLRLIINLEQNGSTYTGKLTSVDQGNASMDMDTVSFTTASRAVRFELKKIAATYEGTLSANGTEITGTWKQPGGSAPLTLRKPGASDNRKLSGTESGGEQTGILGEWQGMLSKLHLIVTIEGGTGNQLTGKILSPDQGNVSIPMETVSLAQKDVHFELNSIKASYQGKLNDDGTEIAGTWMQSGNNLPLTLRRPGAAAKATLKPRTMGRVPLEPCRTADGNTEGLCGKYEVFENREAHSGRKIALNIMVLPAQSDKPAGDPFFALAGGPGQSAVEAFPLAGYVSKIRQQRDVVLVDQRGTGQSNPLPCKLRDPQEAQAVLGENIPVEKVRACRADLEKRADLTQYTTSIFADDLDEVRQALGYEKINVFGGSYGTRAALVYLKRHGDQIRSLTLEAVAPMSYRLPLAFSHTIQDSVDRIIARCANDEACHKNFPDLKKEFLELIARLEKSPAHFELKTAAGETQAVVLTRGGFVANLRAQLYIPSIISLFPSMIHKAYQGDWQLYGATAMAIRGGIETAISRGLAFSVACAEDVANTDEETIQRETRGTYLGDFQVRQYQNACKEWPQGKIPSGFYTPARSAVPTLLISGALDPATPPSTAAEAAKDLSNSRVVAIKDGTHGTGSPCIDNLVSQFVEQGSANGLDTACVDQIHVPPFAK
ncbi:MAG TPA: alpha/beta hydrolase [Candidatus Angelobacter sp.]|nr:alpha/beta hydrolase [Candidatus Angelobacter sp.]